MVQSLGISIGNANSYVAAGKGGGIEILLNEYSNRSTPSMVAFTDHSRSIGMDASSNLFMNMKNTIYDIMLLLGRPFKEIDLTLYSFKFEEAADGRALVVIRHLNEEKKFTITQILAMLFTKLREVANGATDCVISCPQFFNDFQKSELLQAALVAGLRPLQIISDMSAIVLNYAYYRTTKEETEKIVAFINIGQSNLQTVVASFNPKDDTVKFLACESESIGGKDFDRVLTEHFIKEYNLKLTPKAYLKLLHSCEKLKKLLSANANDVPLHVESLISEGEDFTARIDRAKFELICQPLFDKINNCLKRAKETAQTEIQFVETVGGSIRVPAIKQLVKDIFNVDPSTTLNTDEAVARGCVLHCATIHPGMIVNRKVKVEGSELFFKSDRSFPDEGLRRTESDLIESDRKYKSRTESRNNLEEFIYLERSKLQEGDDYLTALNDALEWLFSDEGEEAPEEDYLNRMSELKRIAKSKEPPALEPTPAGDPQQQQPEQQQQQKQQQEQQCGQQQQGEKQQPREVPIEVQAEKPESIEIPVEVNGKDSSSS